MVDVPEWLRDVPVPSQEEFEVIDRRMAERELEKDAQVAGLLARPDL